MGAVDLLLAVHEHECRLANRTVCDGERKVLQSSDVDLHDLDLASTAPGERLHHGELLLIGGGPILLLVEVEQNGRSAVESLLDLLVVVEQPDLGDNAVNTTVLVVLVEEEAAEPDEHSKSYCDDLFHEKVLRILRIRLRATPLDAIRGVAMEETVAD